jgi:two-component system response regulator TtrR
MSASPANALIYVVDDDEAFRDSLRWLLESAGYRVATYATAEHFLAIFDAAAGACVVLDVRMPGMSGLELQEEMLRRGHVLPIIFVTGHGDVPMAVNAVKKGAVDFIEKPFNDMDFLALVEKTIRLNGTVLRDRTRQLSAAARLTALTQREREVMERVVAGKPNKVIADELTISIKTVESHRARVMEKTGAKSVAELVQLALEARRVPPAHNEPPS